MPPPRQRRSSPEGAASVSRSAGDRLDSSLAVSVGLCVLVFIVLQWMGSYSPHWGKSIWHHVSEAFSAFSVTLALMPMYWLCAGSLRRKNKTFVVTWGAVLVQLLFFGFIRHVTADITSDIGNELFVHSLYDGSVDCHGAAGASSGHVCHYFHLHAWRIFSFCRSNMLRKSRSSSGF